MNGKANVVRMSWLAFALLPLLVGSAGAANLNPSRPDQQMSQATHPDQPSAPSGQAGQYRPMLYTARDLIGAKVVNEKGEELGTVWDIVLTPDHSAVGYVALSHAWSWGGGGKLFAVPWSRFQVRPGGKVLVLSNVSKAELDQAKGFDPQNWPAAAEENWLGGMPQGSMTPAAPGSGPPAGSEGTAVTPGMQTGDQDDNAMSENVQERRVSVLTGQTVENPQGEKLGKLHDVVIDVDQGRVAFGILSLRGKALQMSRNYAAVPWSAFQFAARPEVIQLDTTPQTLAALAFKGGRVPDLADPQYSRELSDRFHATPYGQTFGFVPGGNTEQDDPPAPLYRPNAVQTIHGTIYSLGSYPLPGSSVPGLLLNVQTDGGQTVAVQAGPRPYVQKEDFVFHPGDKVTITGAPALMTGGNIFLASQIKLGDRTLHLFNEHGQPLWNMTELRSAGGYADSAEFDQSGAPVGSEY
jgi:sporulation protein YlmC with PRC-barrel domain